MFTVIPVRPFEVDRGAATRAMAALPWLALLLGLAAGALVWGLGTLASPLLGAIAGLALLAAVTGALHLDGVADTADGLGSRKSREEALEIMRRSDIGPMGVVTLLFVLLLDVAALASTSSPLFGGAALAVAVMGSRLAVSIATVSRRSARTTGFGALFVGVTARSTAVVNAVLAVLVGLGLGWLTAGWTGAVALAVGGVVAALVATWWGRRLVRRFGVGPVTRSGR
nr:adenosylcobinamide-GDP ribazoletransferase [Tessaracoccus coleopterorum]